MGLISSSSWWRMLSFSLSLGSSPPRYVVVAGPHHPHHQVDRGTRSPAASSYAPPHTDDSLCRSRQRPQRRTSRCPPGHWLHPPRPRTEKDFLLFAPSRPLTSSWKAALKRLWTSACQSCVTARQKSSYLQWSQRRSFVTSERSCCWLSSCLLRPRSCTSSRYSGPSWPTLKRRITAFPPCHPVVDPV